jgi:hypothetical protein
MKRYLRHNPMGALPNTRLRYLSAEQKLIYLRAAIEDGERSGIVKGFSLKKLAAQLRDRKIKLKRRHPSRQVGVIDRANPRFRSRTMTAGACEDGEDC